jgi:hypothetical protein
MRECVDCGFSADESEFIAAGLDAEGATVLMHRDDAQDVMVLVCCGCAAALGRQDSAAMRAAVWQLLIREVRVDLDVEGFLAALGVAEEVPIPFTLVEPQPVIRTLVTFPPSLGGVF